MLKNRSSDWITVLKNFLALGFVRGFDYVIPIVSLPYLIAVLGVDGFGKVEFANSLSMYCAAVINYGFAVTAVRKIAVTREDTIELTRTFSSTLVTGLILAAAMTLVFSVVIYAVPAFSDESELYWGSFLFASISALFPVWMFRGLENVQLSALITGVARLLYVVMLFVLVRTAADYVLVPWIHGYSMLLATLVALFILIRRIGFSMPTKRDIAQVLRDGFANFIAQLMPNLYNNSATFLLGLIAGPAAVGIFSAARKVGDVFNAALLIGANALFPFLLRRPQAAQKVRVYMVIAGFALGLLCYLSAPYVSMVLFPEIAGQVAVYLKWLSIGVVGYSGVLAYQQAGLLLMHRDLEVMRLSVVVSLAVFLVGAGLILLGAGVNGAVAMLVGARLGMAVGSVYGFRRAHRGTR